MVLVPVHHGAVGEYMYLLVPLSSASTAGGDGVDSSAPDAEGTQVGLVLAVCFGLGGHV